VIDKLFIQFYSRIINSNPRFSNINLYELCNGFSDTYDLCKDYGDFYWINHKKQTKAYGRDEESCSPEFPIQTGTVYVSAYYATQLYQTYLWALNYPEIEFIVGGPSSNPNVFILRDSLPSNLTIINKSVEEYFNKPNWSCEWKLDVPHKDPDFSLAYGYTLRSDCYWGKCIFCNQSQGNRIRKTLGFEFKNVDYPGFQRVNLYTPAMTAKQFKELFNELQYSELVRYDIYLRGNKAENDALNVLFENRTNRFPRIKFIIGVEFPSERMLNYMNKNATVEGILEIVKTICKYGNKELQIQLPFILGWNNLIDNDTIELKTFLDNIPYGTCNISFSLNMLTARPNTVVHETYEVKKELQLGPFYIGFIPKISGEQRELGEKCRELLRNYPVTLFDYKVNDDN